MTIKINIKTKWLLRSNWNVYNMFNYICFNYIAVNVRDNEEATAVSGKRKKPA